MSKYLNCVALIMAIGLVLSVSHLVHALPADLNRDGKVDFADFFIFVDQFGQTWDPEPIVPDTVEVVKEIEVTVNDTLYLNCPEEPSPPPGPEPNPSTEDSLATEPAEEEEEEDSQEAPRDTT